MARFRFPSDDDNALTALDLDSSGEQFNDANDRSGFDLPAAQVDESGSINAAGNTSAKLPLFMRLSSGLLGTSDTGRTNNSPNSLVDGVNNERTNNLFADPEHPRFSRSPNNGYLRGLLNNDLVDISTPPEQLTNNSMLNRLLSGLDMINLAPAEKMRQLDQAIERLNLNERTKEAAYAYKKEFPNAIFTSGRRTIEDQARAMAQNVVKKADFISDTYKKNPLTPALQQWVNQHPNATIPEIQRGLLDILTAPNNVGNANRLSQHLTGNAFDVQPLGGDEGERQVAALKALPGTYIGNEAGLEKRHYASDPQKKQAQKSPQK